MKKIILSILFLVIAGISSNIYAQLPGGGTPTGNGDANIGSDGIKIRSVELERIKREAFKSDPNAFGAINTNLESKFPQVKEDFESIQTSEAAIIKAYTMSKEIDYKLIEKSAKDINKKAKRLDANLFLYTLDPEDREKFALKGVKKQVEIKDIIVGLDKVIGEFVGSKIFQNYKSIDPEVAKKARIDLDNILKASENLAKTAGKMK
jgi:hypothetical protein